MKKKFIAKDKKKYFLCDDKSILNVKDVIELFASVNWGKNEDYNISEVKKAIKCTSILYFVIDENGKLAGLIRGLSDFNYCTYITDIIVRPAYQRKGIGEVLIKAVKKKTSNIPIFLHTYAKDSKFFSDSGMKYKPGMKVFTYKNKNK
ncbi:MAG: GNAT family N-acetyltransferase [Ignavibacteriae bacterium]|nr:MAG: GNAT family N-acetyltransferase [Ignavibacteriota bacterium]